MTKEHKKGYDSHGRRLESFRGRKRGDVHTRQKGKKKYSRLKRVVYEGEKKKEKTRVKKPFGNSLGVYK